MKFFTVSGARSFLATAALAAFLTAIPLSAAEVSLKIVAARWELRPGLITTVWSYNGRVPGTAIIVEKGEKVVIEAANQLQVATNIHWHGLELPNDQDGPTITIPPGGRFRYEFIAGETGTYWYHTHQRPVLPQLDRGLYGAFIVKAPEDAKYSSDQVFVLDDWYLDANGKRLEGTDRGDMERYGNLETVNGKTAEAIEPLIFQSGEIHKLRFINASTAAVHTLRIEGHQFRITHTDGHPLAQPYAADLIVLSPGERIDAEVAAVGKAGESYAIVSDRPELGLRIPIAYRSGAKAQVVSPFIPPISKAFPGIGQKAPDTVLELNSAMGNMMSGGMGQGMMDMGGGMAPMMRWTINGSSYPETEPIFVKTGKLVKLRIRNSDSQMMHKMDHPIHIHGTYFQVVSVNGRDPERELWKDTINVPAGQYVDIAFIMKNPGQWMLHCHIIDHEDGGMMTMLEVSE